MQKNKKSIDNKIYKFASIESAIQIINDGRLLLNNPSSFNDPFDCNIKRDKKDISKVRKIAIGFTSATMLVNLTRDPKIAAAVKKNPSFDIVKKEYQMLIKALKKNPRFDGNAVFTTLYKIMGIKSEVFKKQAEHDLMELEKRIDKSLKEAKEDLLVTCFSKKYSSILMWSHYANSHTGVCIEYERPASNDFVDVKYSKRRPKMRLAELVSFITAKTILNEDYNPQSDQRLISVTIEPFIVKSIEWKYEEEVRCLVSKNSKSKAISSAGEKIYYQMPKPTRIYIGCRARGKKMNELITLAKKKGINCVFLKQDSDKFSLVEK